MSQSPLQQFFEDNVPLPSELTELKKKQLLGGGRQIPAIFLNILIPVIFSKIHILIHVINSSVPILHRFDCSLHPLML